MASREMRSQEDSTRGIHSNGIRSPACPVHVRTSMTAGRDLSASASSRSHQACQVLSKPSLIQTDVIKATIKTQP
jgi:hypothetical protein